MLRLPIIVICFGTSSSRFHPCHLFAVQIMAVLISIYFNVNNIEIDLFRHLFRCCNVLQSRALWCAGSDPGASIDSSTHRLGITALQQIGFFDSIRFVDKAFVIRALHLRAPSATALLEETLQCSKCVCTRTVCVRDVNFTV